MNDKRLGFDSSQDEVGLTGIDREFIELTQRIEELESRIYKIEQDISSEREKKRREY